MEAISRSFRFLNRKLSPPSPSATTRATSDASPPVLDHEEWAISRSFRFLNRKLSRPSLSATKRPTSEASPPVLNHEEPIHGDVEEQNIHSQVSEPNALAVDSIPGDTKDINNPPNHFDWAAIIVAFTLTSAVEIALQSLQPQIKIPLLVHLLSLAMIFAFASIFVSSFLSPNYPNVARTLKLTAKLSVFAAFFFAITVPFSLSLKLISWSIFGLCLLVIAYAAFAGGAVPRE